MAFFILSLTAIAAGLVSIRRDELLTNHQCGQLKSQLIQQRSEIWRQDVDLGALRVPDQVRRRAEEHGLSLQQPGQAERNRTDQRQ